MKTLSLSFAAVAVLAFGTSCNSTQSSLVSSKSKAHRIGAIDKRVVRTTAYSCKENEKGGKYGSNNACGTRLQYGAVRSAAADWSRYPVGTKFRIAGQPHLYVIDDYGSALVGTGTIDIYKPTLSMMRSWGVQNLEIEVLQWGSYHRSAEILKGRLRYKHTRKMYNDIQPKLRRSEVVAAALPGNAQG